MKWQEIPTPCYVVDEKKLNKNDDSRPGNGPKSLQTGSHSLNPSRPDTTDTH